MMTLRPKLGMRWPDSQRGGSNVQQPPNARVLRCDLIPCISWQCV